MILYSRRQNITLQKPIMLALGNGILNLEISVINVGSLLQTIVHKYSCLGEEVSGHGVVHST